MSEEEEVAEAEASIEGDDDDEEGGAHEPIRTIRASCGGKGPRQPPVAASHACEEPRIAATWEAGERVFFCSKKKRERNGG